MINTRTDELAALYVLDLLDSNERVLFEDRLGASPELRRLVREMSAGLYATARKADGPSRPDLLDGILARIEAGRMADKSGPGRKMETRSFSLPWTYIWAAAAILFLGLNLGLLILMSAQSASRRNNFTVAQQSAASSGVDSGSETNSLARDKRELLEARITRLENILAETEAELRSVSEERKQLEGDYRDVMANNSDWQREYIRLAARFLPFFESDGGLSRFTVIEMVDDTLARTQSPRGGFAELAERYLSGESKIAGVRPDELMGPFFKEAGNATTQDATQSGLTPLARGDFSLQNLDSDSSAQSPSASIDSTEGISSDAAAGFTVWRDDEQKGFLDVYNLPGTAEGQMAYLWVRSSELDPYLPVGELPHLENGTGSLFYSVEEPNFTPTEILITAEPEIGPGSEPSGSILLRGP